MEVNKLLEERGKEYGDFVSFSKKSQYLKDQLLTAPSRRNWTFFEAEALDMIVHKIARICNGNPHNIDSWRDIAGYAQLVVNELENPNETEHK